MSCVDTGNRFSQERKESAKSLSYVQGRPRTSCSYRGEGKAQEEMKPTGGAGRLRSKGSGAFKHAGRLHSEGKHAGRLRSEGSRGFQV